jgi:hypothetical protein
MRVEFAKEELKESTFVTKNNGLLGDMKMNVRVFDLCVNSIQCLDHEGWENNYFLIGIDIIKDR